MISILFSFLAGVVLFLLGMNLIKTGLESLTSHKVIQLISKLTATPLKAMLTGTAATFFIQSSSAVTVITISLVNSGLMTLGQAVGIVLGTNMGTSFTALLFTFDILEYYPLLATAGLLMLLPQNQTIKFSGITLIGFSMVFWGLITLQQAFLPLKESETAISLLAVMGENHLTGIIAGTIFTALIQSSSATTGIIIALALQDMITLPGAIALILGSNVGTCITALIVSITAIKSAKRVAYAHILLNMFGVILFFPFITSFSNLMFLFSASLPAQVAWSQITFNVISSMIVLPFTKSFAKLLLKF
ncbi:MAG: Na/Pi cotransporter family protein [Clostridia bacterium]|nr:Na/Pi cotransporter family protein [Clostridia bacterium]